MNEAALEQAVAVLRQGGVIAYPTESVYGLGCDPDNAAAIRKLLALKQRSPDKGLILIAADFAQLAPYLDEIGASRQQAVLASWPGPVTWLWPARPTVSRLLRGAHDTLAVRVTAHPIAAQLCRRFGKALVSTSANRSGQPPARDAATVREQFGSDVDYVVDAPTGGLARPTTIRDAVTGEVLREGG
jgi:L-threonylcarbamoyladenylate synthase